MTFLQCFYIGDTIKDVSGFLRGSKQPADVPDGHSGLPVGRETGAEQQKVAGGGLPPPMPSHNRRASSLAASVVIMRYPTASSKKR